MSSARLRVRVLRGYDGGAPEVAGASRTASGHVYIALGLTSMECMSRLEQMMFISSVQFSSVQKTTFLIGKHFSVAPLIKHKKKNIRFSNLIVPPTRAQLQNQTDPSPCTQ